MLRLAQYDVHIEYLRGKENIIADALSHVGPLAPESQDYASSLNNVEKIPVHQITQIAPASNERLEELHVRPQPRITNCNYWPRWYTRDGSQHSKTVPTVYSHTGASEMILHMKMESCTKEFN